MSGHVFGDTSLSGSAQAYFGDINYYQTRNDEQIKRACLQALRCPDSFAVKIRLKEKKDKVLYHSFQWILNDSKYTTWKDGIDVALLWIKGGPGKGKTMMSIGMIEELARSLKESATVIYFFCQNADYELNTVEAIVKGLILQLAQQQEQTKDCLLQQWDVLHQRLSEKMQSWRGLWDVFLEMIDRCPLETKVYIVIDGLDECRHEGMADLLKIIVRTGLSHPPRVKWLLTSRPLSVAERELLAGSDQVRIDLELNLDNVSTGIRGYIKHKVLEFDRRWAYGPKLLGLIEQQLLAKAENTFLWVSLVCKCIENVDPGDVLATIQDLPPDLRGLYHQVYTDLCYDQSRIAKGCIQVLSVMILALRPLTMDEVGMLAGISLEREFVSAITDRIALFVMITGSHLEFVHQSARD